MERWARIIGFEGYAVSDRGRVRNNDTDRILALVQNQNGVIHVGLSKDKVQYKRAVGRLVAQAFVRNPNPRLFDSVIHLDGDNFNLHFENLMWRPRWFAGKYHKQFRNTERGYRIPIRDIKTGEEFPNSWEAAVKYGLIDVEIMHAINNRTYVFPTFQMFELIEDFDE